MSTATGAVEFDQWTSELRQRLGQIDKQLERLDVGLRVSERGTVTRAQDGVAEVRGLPGVRSEEIVLFPRGNQGLAFDLTRNRVGIVALDEPHAIRSGDIVRRTGRVMSVPVGEATIGRVLDPTGRPLDGQGPVATEKRLDAERPAPDIMDRAPVEKPLQTGIVAVDALVPIGRGQRELILGDRQTGKTSLAVDTIINQQADDVVCIYVAIGQRASSVAKVLADLRDHGAFEYTTAVVTTGEDTPGQRFVAPYAATSMGEWFMERGRDVLVVYDDLTRHARAYRELSLLLRRPPGREAYPGDIFYIHSRLLERPTQLVDDLGGGSMTALPIIETQAEDVSAYIPTNLISITDGQIYLSPKIFQRGLMPAIDVGRSVSRVGGEAQLPAYQAIVGDLRIRLSQMEELERFSRYGATLEEERAKRLERGRRVREVLQQSRYANIPVTHQIAILVSADRGVFDEISINRVSEISKEVGSRTVETAGEIFERVRNREKLSDEDLDAISEAAERSLSEVVD